MKSIEKFKTSLESVSNVIKWNPTKSDLEKIALCVTEKSPSSPSEIDSIIAEICPDSLFACLEGIDNSDLNTLLAMAIAITNDK
ncbi:MAG: hypothetical protein WCK96_08035 [Methylococcales bacterium]